MSVKEQISEQSIAEYKEYLEPLKKLRKKGNKGYTIFIIICCVIGGFAGFFIAMMEDKINIPGLAPFPVPDGFEFLYFVALFAFYLVTTILHTIIHEGGHLVFGHREKGRQAGCKEAEAVRNSGAMSHVSASVEGWGEVSLFGI